MARTCCSSFGQYYGQATSFFCEDTRTCATCRTALWHLDALCYEGYEGHGSANGLPQPIMELAERSHEQTYLGWYC